MIWNTGKFTIYWIKEFISNFFLQLLRETWDKIVFNGKCKKRNVLKKYFKLVWIKSLWKSGNDLEFTYLLSKQTVSTITKLHYWQNKHNVLLHMIKKKERGHPLKDGFNFIAYGKTHTKIRLDKFRPTTQRGGGTPEPLGKNYFFFSSKGKEKIGEQIWTTWYPDPSGSNTKKTYFLCVFPTLLKESLDLNFVVSAILMASAHFFVCSHFGRTN